MDTQTVTNAPHYLLFVETGRDQNSGRWHFSLREANGDSKVEVEDVEPDVFGERLGLLTIIRALEALDQPSRVTLTSCTHYILQGMQYGIYEWRVNGWQWEFFGELVPIKNADLWRRLDHLLSVHKVECRQYRIDGAHRAIPERKFKRPSPSPAETLQLTHRTWMKQRRHKQPTRFRRHFSAIIETIARRCFSRLHTASKPCPGSG
ncbi:MAG: RNase H family protein [Thermoguttaceae bacterium]